MAGKKGIEAGRAYVKAYLDDSLVGRGLKRMAAGVKAFGGQLRSVGTGMAGLATAAAAPLLAAAKTFSDMGSDMLDLSQRTGLSVEALSELKYAADQSGSSIETVEKGVRKMGQVLLDADQGTQTAKDSLKELGLTLADLKGKSPEEQFRIFADAISKVEDPGRRSALAMEIFGKSGSELLPLMLDGAAGIEALREEARKLGITMSTQDAVAAEQFGDQMSSLAAIMKAKLFSAGAAVVPILSRIIEHITAGAVYVGKFIDRNRGLISGLFLGIAAFGALGAGIAVVGTVLSVLGTAIGGITAAVAFLLSPVGLIGTALITAAAGAAYLAHQSGQLGKVLDWLQARFGPLIDAAKTAFRGIKDALSAGELGLAAEIAMAAVELAVAVVSDKIRDIWQSLTDWMGFTWRDMVAGLESHFVKVEGWFSQTWKSISDGNRTMADFEQDQAVIDQQSNAVINDAARIGSQENGASKRAAEKRIEDAKKRLAALANEAAGAADEAARLKLEAAPEAEKFEAPQLKLKDTARPAINTAAVVGSQSGADAFLKATQGFGRKVTPGEKAIADALKTTNKHLEDIAEGGVALMEDDA